MAVPSLDQRGSTRIGGADIGAYEYAKIDGEAEIMVGEVYDLKDVSPLAAGLFETVECTDGWEDIISFDPESNERIKGLAPGEVTIKGYVQGVLFAEIIVTVTDEATPDIVTDLSITDCPEDVSSEV